jgi:2'-5' RNA ligase superfamily
MSPLPVRMTDHWWWRPGVRPDRRLYVWHILFDGQAQVTTLARDCQALLAGVPGLDLIMCDVAAKHLQRLVPVSIALGRPLFHSEAIMFGVRPAGVLDSVRESVREAVATTVDAHQLAEGTAWTPHVSIAYSNREGPSAPILNAMRGAPAPVDVRVHEVHLVSQERIGRSYRWNRVATVPLGIA